MPTVAITGLSAKSNYGSLRIFSSDWYSFYFEQQNILDGYGSANKAVDGETATVSNDALIALGDYSIGRQKSVLLSGGYVVSGVWIFL